jgi:hypothetical protein
MPDLYFEPSVKVLTVDLKYNVKFAEGAKKTSLRVASSITVHFDASSLSSYFLIFSLKSNAIRAKNESSETNLNHLKTDTYLFSDPYSTLSD